MRTDPDTQEAWFAQEDARLDYGLQPFTQLMKRWNVEHGKPFKSYHLSVMIAKMFTGLGGDTAETVRMFFAPHRNWPRVWTGRLQWRHDQPI